MLLGKPISPLAESRPVRAIRLKTTCVSRSSRLQCMGNMQDRISPSALTRSRTHGVPLPVRVYLGRVKRDFRVVINICMFRCTSIIGACRSPYSEVSRQSRHLPYRHLTMTTSLPVRFLCKLQTVIVHRRIQSRWTLDSHSA